PDPPDGRGAPSPFAGWTGAEADADSERAGYRSARPGRMLDPSGGQGRPEPVEARASCRSGRSPEEAMSDLTVSIEDVRVPRFLYGTAWKEDETRRLAELALRQGFRGIDTANQRRHYHEAAVGQAVAAVIADGLVTRD